MSNIGKSIIIIIGLFVGGFMLDKFLGRILYHLDPAFKRYVDAKSKNEKSSAGEKISITLRDEQSGDIKIKF